MQKRKKNSGKGPAKRRQRKVRNGKGKGQPGTRQKHPDAAGVDIGADEIFVAVAENRDAEPVRKFGTYTEELHGAADWLKSCGVTSVAMESTGVYWIPFYQILEARGFEVYLVNARHCRNAPGRRTDFQDCQWLQELHEAGLLSPSFRPTQEVCAIRSLLRHRQSLVEMASEHIQHMQKALDQMNVQVHHVLSDITGMTGIRIVDAIVAGERDAKKLAKLRDHRVMASEEEIVKALTGDYRSEHLFVLRQSLEAYRQCQKWIVEIETEVRKQTAQFPSAEAAKPPTECAAGMEDDTAGKTGPSVAKPGSETAGQKRVEAHKSEEKSKKKPGKKPTAEEEMMRLEMERIWGVDVTIIPGIGVLTAQNLFTEVGADLSKFRSAGAFASWLGLCPDKEISGGKVLWTGTRKVKSRASLAFRLAAQALHKSQSYLGDFYRRMKNKLGGAEAITAAAHKLARIWYHLVTTRQPFDETRFAAQKERAVFYRRAGLYRAAKAMGMMLVPLESV